MPRVALFAVHSLLALVVLATPHVRTVGLCLIEYQPKPTPHVQFKSKTTGKYLMTYNVGNPVDMMKAIGASQAVGCEAIKVEPWP